MPSTSSIAVNACLPRGRRGAPPRCGEPPPAAPVAMMRPWCSTAIWCAIENTTSMSCSVNSSVRPRSLAMRSSSAIDSCVSCALMPAVGSSSSSMRGSPASAMPSSTCFCAPWLTSPAIEYGDVLQRQVLDHLRGLVAELALGHAPHVEALAAMRDEGGLDVLVHRELGEDVGALEGAGDPHAADLVRGDAGDVAALQHHLAAIRLRVPGDQIEERRLAGAVRADDGGDAPLLDVQAHVVGGDEARERFAQACGRRASSPALSRQTARAPEQRHGWRRPRRPETRTAGRAGCMPSTNGQYSV